MNRIYETDSVKTLLRVFNIMYFAGPLITLHKKLGDYKPIDYNTGSLMLGST